MITSKNKILTAAVILLMLANVALMATLWWHHRSPRHPGRGTPADYLVKELGLNTDQQNKLKELASEHHQQSEKIREKIKDARHELFSLLQQPGTSDSIKKSAADNVSKQLEELDLLTFDHFQQVRALCTPEQQKKFDAIIEDVLEMIASGSPPPRNGERPPPGERRPPPEH